MSYNHNLYVGWYLEFDEPNRKEQIGTTNVRFCPTSKKHPTKDKFCPKCGKEIQTKEEPNYKTYSSPHELIHITEQEELTEATLGKLTLKDIEELQDCLAPFPEFLGTKKNILMAPGFTSCTDISRCDGFVTEVDFSQKPTQEWIDRMKYIFDVEKMNLKFGVVMEVV